MSAPFITEFVNAYWNDINQYTAMHNGMECLNFPLYNFWCHSHKSLSFCTNWIYQFCDHHWKCITIKLHFKTLYVSVYRRLIGYWFAGANSPSLYKHFVNAMYHYHQAVNLVDDGQRLAICNYIFWPNSFLFEPNIIRYLYYTIRHFIQHTNKTPCKNRLCDATGWGFF